MEDMVSWDVVALAVSLDIVNAFNSMSWDKIMAALEHFEVPSYLVRFPAGRTCLCESMGVGKPTFPKPGKTVGTSVPFT